MSPPRGRIQLRADVPPSFPLAAFGWQVPLHKLAYVGERWARKSVFHAATICHFNNHWQ
jgi:hypothetical protein